MYCNNFGIITIAVSLGSSAVHQGREMWIPSGYNLIPGVCFRTRGSMYDQKPRQPMIFLGFGNFFIGNFSSVVALLTDLICGNTKTAVRDDPVCAANQRLKNLFYVYFETTGCFAAFVVEIHPWGGCPFSTVEDTSNILTLLTIKCALEIWGTAWGRQFTHLCFFLTIKT